MTLGRLLGRGAGRLTGTLANVFTRLVDRASDALGSREAALALGSVSFLLAVLVAALPAAWLPPAVPLAGDLLLANRRAIFVVGVITGIAGVWWLSERSEPADDPAVTIPDRHPEFAYFTEGRAVGEAIDRATSGEELAQWETNKFRRETYDSLYEAAVVAISEAENCAPQLARNRLAEGTWTDSPRAARFLGDQSETRLPLSVRIRDWASGESYRRHVRDTVEAITAIDPEYRDVGEDVTHTTADAATDRRAREERAPQPVRERSTATAAADDRRWAPGDDADDTDDESDDRDGTVATDSTDGAAEESDGDTDRITDHEVATGVGGDRP
ncbi:hypothetical protein SAMN04487949_0068 [Halogranum gelatinilyticum]|uniref:Uncharacterized protein n=1 Tax=Halogranum gelatinilyticum TaxID=660521 RepID=A0A1G9NR71_9EURY|nr:hypothetical protein [Halogranum gelatinilyticum]SDL88793.1 hypothetical protein SAMN04487949_0068 [Halogranum gelatinilyticum]